MKKRRLLLVDPTEAGKRHTLNVLRLDKGVWDVLWVKNQHDWQGLVDRMVDHNELPDIMITSLCLGNDNPAGGLDLIKALRAQVLQRVPVIVWSKLAHFEDLEASCLEAGADEVLEKNDDDQVLPVKFEMVLAMA
jgi:CheY-like chemotaxis protein